MKYSVEVQDSVSSTGVSTIRVGDENEWCCIGGVHTWGESEYSCSSIVLRARILDV
jgi:hypothetical protein